MEIGQKVKIREIIPVFDDNDQKWEKEFLWNGEIIQITSAFIETKHRRNAITHPQWMGFKRAYTETLTKHYFHPDNQLNTIVL